MPFEERSQMLSHQRQFHHFSQRAVRQLWNDLCRQAIFRRCFNHQCELRRGLRKFDGRLRRRILRAVNDVAPMNQVRERLGIEAELCVLVKTFAVKPAKESGGSSAIKAAIVKAEPDLGHRLAYSLLRLRTIRIQARRSQPTCTWAAGLSRRKG